MISSLNRYCSMNGRPYPVRPRCQGSNLQNINLNYPVVNGQCRKRTFFIKIEQQRRTTINYPAMVQYMERHKSLIHRHLQVDNLPLVMSNEQSWMEYLHPRFMTLTPVYYWRILCLSYIKLMRSAVLAKRIILIWSALPQHCYKI